MARAHPLGRRADCAGQNAQELEVRRLDEPANGGQSTAGGESGDVAVGSHQDQGRLGEGVDPLHPSAGFVNHDGSQLAAGVGPAERGYRVSYCLTDDQEREVRAAESIVASLSVADVVGAEGPIIASRMYELCVRASGGSRVGMSIRKILNRATASAVRSGRIAQLTDDQPGHMLKTLHLPGTPEVVLRTRGSREVEQIPTSEVAELIKRLLQRDPQLDEETLKRIVLTHYDRIRLTANASSYLDRCLHLART